MSKSIFRRTFNRALHLLAQFAPGVGSFRPWLHKMRGVKIIGKVFIGDQTYIENEYPEQIEIHDGTQITVRCTLLAHFRGVGKIIVEKNCFIGTGVTIFAPPGRTVVIGAGSVIDMGTRIKRSVPPGVFVAGNPPRPVKKVTVPWSIHKTYEEQINGLEDL